jgi:predicted ribosome quality control (RQC) complex YloA/Tae2 family protein
MATMQGMSGVDVKAVVYELSGLLPLWVNKVYQVTPKNMIIRLNGENHAKYQMLIESGRRIHLIRTMPPTPKLPPQFAMLLRIYRRRENYLIPPARYPAHHCHGHQEERPDLSPRDRAL